MISPDAFDYMSALAEDLTNDRDAWRARAEQAEAQLAKLEALAAANEAAHSRCVWIADLRAALAPPEDRPKALPDNWFVRKGHFEDGAEFTYCIAEGPQRAHCILPIGHTAHSPEHEWAWFTREDRAKAEVAPPEDSQQ